MNRKITTGRCSGLTLIELLMALAVGGILLGIATPSFKNLIHATRIRAESDRLMVSLNLARNEAILRNLPVSICPSAFHASGEALCSGEFADGWIVFSNGDKDRIVDQGSDEIIRAFAALPTGFTLTNKAGTVPARELISYLPDGTSRRNRTLMVCAPPGSQAISRSVVLNSVGRPRAVRGWGECPSA